MAELVAQLQCDLRNARSKKRRPNVPLPRRRMTTDASIATAGTAKVNILLVDDSPGNLLVLESLLTDLDENLVLATSGEEALEKVQEQDFAAILMDVKMPTMDGFEAAVRIRGLERSRATPILFVTAAGREEHDVRRAYSMGAVDFLTKPIVPEILRAKVAVFVELGRGREQLRAERAFLHSILESVQDSIVGCAPDGQITLLNRSARALCERSDPNEAVRLLTTTRSATAARSPLSLALAGERVDDLRVSLGKDEDRRILKANGGPLVDSEGRNLGAVVSLHDSTAQDQAIRETVRRQEAEALAEQLRRSQDHLQHLAAELTEADRRKTEFLATLAHELRNPLSPLQNGLQVLRLARNDEALRDKTRDMMQRQLDQLVRLVDDLLDVARITSGKLQLRKERVDLRAAVQSALESSAPILQARAHALEVQLPSYPLHVHADAARMTQVICNMLNNAAKYTPTGGRVRVQARKDDNTAVLEIADTGVGIPADEIGKVFSMFTQVDRNLEHAQGGLGIGLALVRSVVELHAGTVSVASEGEGRGTTFTVRLPANDAPVQTHSAPPGAGESTRGMRLRIAVIDDNVDAAETLAMVLAMQGHEIRTANEGSQGLDLVRSFSPHLVLLDLGMPGMSGYEVVRALRATPEGKHAYVVALTGWGTHRDRELTAQSGFDYHLTKPAAPQALDSVLGQALERARSPRSPIA